MRPLIALIAIAGSLWSFEGLPSLTVVVDSEKPASPEALSALQDELGRLLSQGGRRLEWKWRQEMGGAEAQDLVVVKLRGNCRLESMMPQLIDERGPLAFTHTADGEVLPFSEVLCDRVASAVRRAIHGGEVRRANQLMGRAIGRVLAHEIWHMTGNTHEHGREGVALRGLSGTQLISDQLDFAPPDADRLRQTTSR